MWERTPRDVLVKKDDQSRVGQCDAIGNGYPTRTIHMLSHRAGERLHLERDGVEKVLRQVPERRVALQPRREAIRAI